MDEIAGDYGTLDLIVTYKGTGELMLSGVYTENAGSTGDMDVLDLRVEGDTFSTDIPPDHMFNIITEYQMNFVLNDTSSIFG